MATARYYSLLPVLTFSMNGPLHRGLFLYNYESDHRMFYQKYIKKELIDYFEVLGIYRRIWKKNLHFIAAWLCSGMPKYAEICPKSQFRLNHKIVLLDVLYIEYFSCWTLSLFVFFIWNLLHGSLKSPCEVLSYKKKREKS